MTKVEFISKANKIHNYKFDYNKVDFEFVTDNIIISCKLHGDFNQKVYSHLSGRGCKECYFENRNKDINTFIYKSKLIYGDKFIYNKFVYLNTKSESEIVCQNGHSFFISPNRHFTGKTVCPFCKSEEYERKWSSLLEPISGFKYLQFKGEKVTIECNKCGSIFIRKTSAHYKLKNCPNCQPKKYKTDKFIQKSIEKHGDKFIYDESEYIDSRSMITLFCKNGHKFVQKANNHLNGTGCPKCNRFNVKESKLLEFIQKNIDTVIKTSDRKVLKGMELDIYLPELKLGFEFNGLYWHSEIFKDKKYHLNKTEICNTQGVELFHIWEDDWMNKQEIVKSMILNKLGKTPNKIFARKCQVRIIEDNKIVRSFLNENHIQGFIGSKIKLGLYHDDELISLMTFGNLRKSLGQKSKENTYELLRFCNKLNTLVAGGASKLFRYFLNNFIVNEVVSYSDYSRSKGNMYQKIGFNLQHNSDPNYYYVIDGVRKHRFAFRKDRLIDEGFDKNKTEIQIMNERGYFRIFDCGMQKWCLSIK